MPYNRDITADDEVFFDTDMQIRVAVYEGNPTAAQIAANLATPVDVSGWSLAFVVRKKPNSANPPLIEKATGSPGGITVTGTFDANPELNTQRVVIQIDDTDTYDEALETPVKVKEGDYAYALKRTDDGSETVLAYGKFKLLRAAAWE